LILEENIIYLALHILFVIVGDTLKCFLDLLVLRGSCNTHGGHSPTTNHGSIHRLVSIFVEGLFDIVDNWIF
jgi:hypothetical protein